MELRDDDDMMEMYATWTGYAHGPAASPPPTPQTGWQLLTLPRPGMLITQLFSLVRRLEPAPVNPTVRT